MTKFLLPIILSIILGFAYSMKEETKPRAKTYSKAYVDSMKDFIEFQDSVISSREELIQFQDSVLSYTFNQVNRLKLICGVPDSVDFSFKTKCIYSINTRSVLKDFSQLNEMTKQRVKSRKLVE